MGKEKGSTSVKTAVRKKQLPSSTFPCSGRTLEISRHRLRRLSGKEYSQESQDSKIRSC